MCQFVKNYILQALNWLFGKLEIQPYLTSIRIARTPTGCHVFGLPRITMQSRNILPFRKIYFNLLFEQSAIPLVYKSFTLTCSAFFSDGEYSFITGKKGETIRQWNKDDLDLYLRSAGGKDFSEVQERELLTAEQLSMEQVMLSLRTSKGMKESDLMADCDPKALEKALSDGNLIRIPDNRVRIPESRFFLSDRIISDLL